MRGKSPVRVSQHYLFATTSIAALLSRAALAADMALPAKAPPPQVPAPVANWTGPYVGLNIGGAWNHSSYTDDGYFFFLLPEGPGDNFWNATHAGFTLGGLAGYNWQFSNIVVGVEGDINWVDGKSSTTVPGSFNPVSVSSNLQQLDTVRGRLGLLSDPATLLYATGGAAFARYSDWWGVSPNFVFADSYWRTGWTAGGGIEHMFAPHWTGRIEALYADFGTQTGTTFQSSQIYRTNFQHAVTLVRGALSYKW